MTAPGQIAPATNRNERPTVLLTAHPSDRACYVRSVAVGACGKRQVPNDRRQRSDAWRSGR
jgi:hypothetical protein